MTISSGYGSLQESDMSTVFMVREVVEYGQDIEHGFALDLEGAVKIADELIKDGKLDVCQKSNIFIDEFKLGELVRGIWKKRYNHQGEHLW
jgi:hypothetical protein